MWKKAKDIAHYIYVFIAPHGKGFRNKLVGELEKLKKGLAQESNETKKMLEIYFHYTQGKSSKEEMDHANQQFRDLLKTLGLGAFVILPFAPITIPLMVTLGRKWGVDILPSAFKQSKK